MQLQSLRYFLLVVSTGSFLATARRAEVPASSVSRAIAALEKELGQQLFYRSTRAVRLTDEGEHFYVQVREALELLDGAAEQLVNRDTGLKGLVRINAPQALGRLHIAPLVNALQAQYVDLEVELTLTDTFIDPVQEGADITFRVDSLTDSGLISRMAAPQRYVLAGSPQYLSTHGMPQAPEELVTHSCLMYKGDSGGQRWYFRRSAQEPFKAFHANGRLRSNSAEALVAAAVAGRGLVLFPTWLFGPDYFKTGALISLMPGWEASASSEPAYIQILSPENRLRSRKVREVAHFLATAIGSPPYWDRELSSATLHSATASHANAQHQQNAITTKAAAPIEVRAKPKTPRKPA